MTFLRAVAWEFVQNGPVMVLFVGAVWNWAQARRGAATAYALVGAVAGALLIRFTEPLATGHTETVAVTLVNVVSMGLLQVLLVAYVGSETRWSNWRMDVLVGTLAGASLAVAQGLAAPEPPIIGIAAHSVALATAGALVLVGIRKLKGHRLTRALLGGLLLAVAMTLVIGLVDYGYFLVW